MVSTLVSAAALAAGILLTDPSRAFAATADEQACVNGVTKAAAKMLSTYEKEWSSCLKNAAKDKLAHCSTVDACLTADLKGKLAKSEAKAESAAACGADRPAWYEGASDIRGAVGTKNFAPSGYLFGPRLDDAYIRAVDDKAGASCQGKVQKAGSKLGATIAKEHAACVKAGLADGSIDSAAELEACMGVVATDASGKVGKAGAKLVKTLDKKCAAVDLDAAFPGTCVGAGDAGACMTAEVRCRACIALNAFSGTAFDCDDFDDESANASCTVADGRCNESSTLCASTFDSVSYATSHNAMSNDDEDWGLPLQTWGISKQLARGVRALMLDTHYFEGAPHLCHGFCDLTQQKVWREPLVDGLVRIRQFLEARPEEIVTIIFESYISEADTATEFTAAGLDPYVHSQTAGQAWPTLEQMIASGRRLVVFTDDGSATLPWHLYLWTDFVWETHFHYESVGEFSCDDNRGSPGNDLFILNHFLTAPLGNKTFASQVNRAPVLRDRALECQTEASHIPNFLTVDFVDVGTLFEVVDELNGLGACAAP